MLRAWGDTVLSLRGYRPVIDVVTPEGRLDSMSLVGFDSPMLARSRMFLQGVLDRPPLLSSSAATCRDFLFVLNMRPGWLRMDVYDRRGILNHVLTEPDPVFDQSFFSTDVAVECSTPGAYQLAVTIAQPQPRIDLYRWEPPFE